ncbi:MAG: type III toxin-antitoxin system ToxN/AbiQ family toxin [Bacilli bacterium]|nr:type III toxin-antitoxin system ToxN/AbiQ family toxin [Bacilli bacterium]
MYKSFKIVKVDSKYCDFLRLYDSKVTYNAGTKDLRPFVGILFMIEKCEYFAPLSSPKSKHKKLKNTLDLIKIQNGDYGVVNFNNMIPVTNKNYVEFDLNKISKDKNEMFRIELLINQLRWLTTNKKVINTKSKLLYDLYKNNKLPKNVKNRCCNFSLLEEKCREYNNSINLI